LEPAPGCAQERRQVPHHVHQIQRHHGIKKDQIELGQAVNAEIRKLWATCENKTIMARYGVINPDFFVPPSPDPRVGVHRGADYKAPMLPAACPA
jgi:hypothetical protein